MRRVIALFVVLAAACGASADPAPPGENSGNGTPTPAPKRDGGVTPVGDAGTTNEGGNPGPSSCNPPPSPGEVYALSARDLLGVKDVPLCQYRGKVVMFVNVASHCGYTPQYGPLEDIYEKYVARGFVILGFPCNQFGAQESGTAEEISKFCTDNYGITFPMMSKIEVNGAGTHPIYQWLKSQPGGAGDITWNFNKFLVGKDGKLIKRWAEGTEPDAVEVTTAIETALAK
jgi:glutathione peroxidase